MKNSLQPKTQTVGKYKLKGTKMDKVGYRVKRNHIPIVITRYGANTMDIRSSNIWKDDLNLLHFQGHKLHSKI
jgi:hypothetical protein